jgi:hypothetical protein
MQKMHAMMQEKQRHAEEKTRMNAVFGRLDRDGSGTLEFADFQEACKQLGKNLPKEDLLKLFELADKDGSGTLNINECQAIIGMNYRQLIKQLNMSEQQTTTGRRVSVRPTPEQYFGEELRDNAPPGTTDFSIAWSQDHSMQLYESRIASMQRAVAFFVLFHEMGQCVADFWPRVSFGMLGYCIDRTHSIMRIATTASPVSGSEVRRMMSDLAAAKEWDQLHQKMTRIQKDWLTKRGSTRDFGNSLLSRRSS